jgi:hypothetical protein
MFVSVTLPTFVTTKLYGTICPASVIEVVVEDFSTLIAGIAQRASAAHCRPLVWSLSAAAVLSMSPSPPPLLSISACVTS